MVILPSGFVATKYPGYFWNINDKKLYSLKISGELRRLKLTQPNFWNKWDKPAYRISHEGRKKILTLEYLTNIKYTDSQISVRGT